jgi:hypothetical protein
MSLWVDMVAREGEWGEQPFFVVVAFLGDLKMKAGKLSWGNRRDCQNRRD